MLHYWSLLREIRTITVLGAGPSGRELARLASQAGYKTIWKDLSDAKRPDWPLEIAVAEADLILEAAPDDLETKVEVYTLIDRMARPHCIFAPTSKVQKVTEIASLTYRAPQVIGIIFSPPLLRLVRGMETSNTTLAVAERVGTRLGLEIERVYECGTAKHQAGETRSNLDSDDRPPREA